MPYYNRETKEIRYGIAEQAAYDTPVIDTAVFEELICSNVNPQKGTGIHEDLPASSSSRSPIAAGQLNTNYGAMGGLTITKPFSYFTDDLLMYSFFHNVTEGGATEYNKAFTFFSSIPDFSADAGQPLTFIKRMPEAAQSQKFGGCICRRWKLSNERSGEEDGLVQAEYELKTRNEGSESSDPPGGTSEAWSLYSSGGGYGFLNFGELASATCDFATSPQNLVIKAWEVEVQHDIAKIGHTGSTFDNVGFEKRRGTFSFDILYDDNLDDFYSALELGTQLDFTIAYRSLVSNAFLDLQFSGKMNADIEMEEEGLIYYKVQGNILANDQTAEFIQLDIANARDRSW
jgi:hypothetical protein